MSEKQNSLKEKEEKLIFEFLQMPDWESRYKKMIEMGKKLPPMDENLKTENKKIKGCQSQVWLHAEMSSNQKIIFHADSDALIVKGLVAVLLEVCSHADPKEVMTYQPTFIEQLGLVNNLSANRANGLMAMIKQIKLYAMAFEMMKS